MSDKPAKRKATHAHIYKMKPQVVDKANKVKTWVTRGGNFAVTVSEVKPGSQIARKKQPDEFMVITDPKVSCTIKAGKETIEAGPDSLTIVPPGASTITATGEGLISCIFSKNAKDIMDLAHNKKTYADGAPELAPLVPWPDPVGGFKLRHYKLSDYYDPKGPRIQPALFRSTNMMVNLFAPYTTRRPTDALSPHWHDDFEQCSLTLSGQWIHHLRYPWSANMKEWVSDDDTLLDTPSLIIIPANVIHTSRDVGRGKSSLYDIFCPPRVDFSRKKGFVINEDEYPAPPGIMEDEKTYTKGALLAWQKPAEAPAKKKA